MSGVTFSCENLRLQRLYDAAEAKMKGNIRDFAGRKVLVEGAGYEKIWLETQPMGGEMNWFRDPESAKNNILLFIENTRSDGRMPGSIQLKDGKIIPQYDKLQGFCFARPALRMYELLLEEDLASGGNSAPEYLDALRICLESFDSWLHKTRDLWHTGVLASFCVYDTGEDNAVRYGDAPCYSPADEAPSGYKSVPMMSMDVTGYAYACRDTLAKIAAVMKNEDEEKRWISRANETRNAFIRALWDEERKACFDRYKNGDVNPVLCHNTLRCMYYGILPGDKAAAFISSHLENPDEFLTPYPFPSTAVNDPFFRNVSGNNWSGQSQALTWQRLLDAADYCASGRRTEELVNRIFATIQQNENCFYQQYDPFTGAHGGGTDGYGPAILSVLRAFDMTRGMYRDGNKLVLGTVKGFPFESTISSPLYHVSLKCDGTKAEASVNGRKKISFDAGERQILDLMMMGN